MNDRIPRYIRNAGVAIVVGSYAVDVITRRTNKARIAADAAKIRATRWLWEPGAGIAVAGEVLVQLSKLRAGAPASPPPPDKG